MHGTDGKAQKRSSHQQQELNSKVTERKYVKKLNQNYFSVWLNQQILRSKLRL